MARRGFGRPNQNEGLGDPARDVVPASTAARAAPRTTRARARSGSSGSRIGRTGRRRHERELVGAREPAAGDAAAAINSSAGAMIHWTSVGSPGFSPPARRAGPPRQATPQAAAARPIPRWSRRSRRSRSPRPRRMPRGASDTAGSPRAPRSGAARRAGIPPRGRSSEPGKPCSCCSPRIRPRLGPELRRTQGIGRARKHQGHRDPEDRDDRERPPHPAGRS